ncbi:hypothetical protein D0T53_11745 [Dysgonomonas sp. 216]|uniref:hypothetical protein n=1 Tax=Dysgonomonas sp. 216 TaxID=2302934 RepID=UPI0013D87906|nr:hypothetical protein [Dysgonomonas sp. 216]NDW19579.1 hypothetical protein [Dysgonomonas sp. 216]
MGFDITYHPITEDEISKWYFDVLEQPILTETLGKEYNIDQFYIDKYKKTISVALQTENSETFEKTHGYYIAVIQGFFRKFFYIRGAAFSFLIEQDSSYTRYTKGWETFIPAKYVNEKANRIVENYSSGVFIPADKVKELLADYENNENIRKALNYFYSHSRITVFLEALKYSAENNLGLLEATEVMEPNPFDLNNSSCYSDLFNCDPSGALLYREAALEQIREIKGNENLTDSEIDSKVTYNRITPNEKF